MTTSTTPKTKLYAIAFLSFNKRLNETYLEADWASSQEETRELGDAWDARYPESEGWSTVMDVKEIQTNGN